VLLDDQRSGIAVGYRGTEWPADDLAVEIRGLTVPFVEQTCILPRRGRMCVIIGGGDRNSTAAGALERQPESGMLYLLV